MPTLSAINEVANAIHTWSEPAQEPWKQMGLTRISGIALAFIEGGALCSHAAFLIGWQLPGTLLKGALASIEAYAPKVKCLNVIQDCLPDLQASKHAMITIAELIAGLVSTLFFGVIFSPEINFHIHQKLSLAVDNVKLKKEKERLIKLETEVQTAAIQQARLARMARLQQQQATKAAEDLDSDTIDSDLAELLLPIA